jgi:hypothetical protein
MPSIINATTTTGLVSSADNSGSLQLATNNGTTAVTISTGQNATFAQTANLPNTFGFKNRIINGDMGISQRNGSSSVTNPGSNTYTVDRWRINTSFTGSVGQNLGSVTPPVGFTSYLGMSVGAAGQSASNYGFLQSIEGFNTADLQWGTANAKTVTVSFWVRSSLTGTFGFAIQNEASNRSYPFAYTISSANTWQQVTATIPGDTSGTWIGATNGTGLQIYISYGNLAARQGPSGAWASADYRSVTGQVDLVLTNGATFYITGVQLEVGTTATSFDYLPYTTELQLCQRYYAKLGANPSAIGNPGYQAHGAGCNQATNTSQNIYLGFPQFMRTSPSIGYSGNIGITALGSYVTLSSISGAYTGVNSSLLQTTTPAVGSAGDGATLISNGDTSAFISLTAEL